MFRHANTAHKSHRSPFESISKNLLKRIPRSSAAE